MCHFDAADCLLLDQQNIIQRFQQESSWEQRYRLLLQLARQMPAFPHTARQDKYRIQGCESRVWLLHQQHHDKHFFIADSDSRIIKGLLALLIGFANGKKAQTITELELPSLLSQLKLDKHLSPSRNNGLNAVLEQILHYTQAQ